MRVVPQVTVAALTAAVLALPVTAGVAGAATPASAIAGHHHTNFAVWDHGSGIAMALGASGGGGEASGATAGGEASGGAPGGADSGGATGGATGGAVSGGVLSAFFSALAAILAAFGL